MISCVAFDFDGTLVDSNPVKIQAFYDIAQSYDPNGFIVSEIIQQNPSADRYDITREIAYSLLAHGFIPPQWDIELFSAQLANSYTETCERSIATCKEVPGTSEILKWLSWQKIPIFLNSRTPILPLRRLVALRSFDCYFSGIYGAPASKSENLRRILERIQINPNKMLFVGDSEDDRLAATESGCQFVGVIFGSENRFTDRPKWQVTDLHELQRVLAKTNGKTVLSEHSLI